jgi:hypothetical protein
MMNLEVIIEQLSDTVLYVSNDLTAFEIRGAIFSPNVSINIDDDKIDPIVSVVDASATFKGIRFSSTKNSSDLKRISVFSAIGASTINLLNCIIHDAGYGINQVPTCKDALLVKYGALVMSSEMINIKDVPTLSYFPLTIIGGETGVRAASCGKIVDTHIYSVNNYSSFAAEPGSWILAKTLVSMCHTDDEINISDAAKIIVY